MSPTMPVPEKLTISQQGHHGLLRLQVDVRLRLLAAWLSHEGDSVMRYGDKDDVGFMGRRPSHSAASLTTLLDDIE